MLGRLNHERVAGRERGRELERHELYRGVPRRNGAHHAHRLAPRVEQVIRLVGRDKPALDLVGQAGEVVVPLWQVLQLPDHLPIQLAVVAYLNAGQPLGVLRDQIREATDAGRPLESGHLAPGSIEGAAGRGDGVIDVLDAALRDAGPGLAGVWVERIKCPVIRRVDEGTANVVLELLKPLGHDLLASVSVEMRMGQSAPPARSINSRTSALTWLVCSLISCLARP